jgi:hypothetical protein
MFEFLQISGPCRADRGGGEGGWYYAGSNGAPCIKKMKTIV